MKNIKKEILNSIIQSYPQFKNKSQLFDDIVKVFDCDLARAKDLASTYCNMISFYSILRASGEYNEPFSVFLKWMIEKGYSDKHGYIKSEKATILDDLNITATLLKYNEIEDIHNPLRLNPDKFYQIKIKGNTSGFHFMAGYVDDGVFKISDTSYRGIGVNATDHITEKNFIWIMEVV